MPFKIKKPASITDIENAIHAWFDLLADEKYLEGFAFCLNESHHKWTPELLELVINGYGLPYESSDMLPKCKVSKWREAISDSNIQYKDVNLFSVKSTDDNKGYSVIGYAFYDMPIDGKWSDLTATFKIWETSDFIALELEDIHVH